MPINNYNIMIVIYSVKEQSIMATEENILLTSNSSYKTLVVILILYDLVNGARQKKVYC